MTQDRTGDLQIFSLTLSQLSYRGSAMWAATAANAAVPGTLRKTRQSTKETGRTAGTNVAERGFDPRTFGL